MLVATESFTGGLGNVALTVVKGVTTIWSDHPAARKWPQFFAPVRVTHETPGRVEQATANPGEKRDFGARMAAARAAKRGAP
jgi:hypothetical protein